MSPGTNNFQQWDPGQSNQESDTAYTSDSLRSGGAPVGAPLPSATANKLFYQVSTGVAALMQMMAAKGYNVSDVSVSTLAGVLSAIQTLADIKTYLQNVAYSPTVLCNISLYGGFQIALNGNVIVTISGGNPGDSVNFIFVQDATGGRTVTFPSSFHGWSQPDPTPNSESIMSFQIDESGNFQAKSSSLSSLGTLITTGLTTSYLKALTTAVAPTPANNDNSTNIATTAWAQLGITYSMTSPGYIKFPIWLGNLTIKWGAATPGDLSAGAGNPVTFIPAFNTTCFAAIATMSNNIGANIRTVSCYSLSTNGFTLGANGSGSTAFWIAIGN